MKLRMKRKAMVILAAGMLMSAAAPAAAMAARSRRSCPRMDSHSSGKRCHSQGREHLNKRVNYTLGYRIWGCLWMMGARFLVLLC